MASSRHVPCAAALAGLALLLGAPASGQTVQGEFFYLLRRTQGQGINNELRGSYSGSLQVALSPRSTYELWILERSPLKRIGNVVFTTGADGSRQAIPPVPLRTLLVTHDADEDGLSDMAESIIGSNPESPDTDGDLQDDLSEFLNGSQLIEVTAARTGIVGSVDTPGNAEDVKVNNELAVVCDRGSVLCFNVFNTLPARVVASVDTPGEARRAAVGDTLVAVADGTAGLQVIDISDPPAARIVRGVAAPLLGGNAERVVVVADLAFVGLSTGVLATVDLRSGDVIQKLQVGTGSLVDLAVAGDALYALEASRLYALALRPGELQVASSVDVQRPSFPAVRLFVGGGVAYVTHGQGVNTFSLANPLQPVLIRATTTAQFGWKQFVADGSGRGLAAVGDRSDFHVTHDVSLYDASDPTQTNTILATFPTPGEARSVALYNGLCYEADGTAGLQVIAYQAADRAGIAPTVSLSTNYPGLTQAEEGQLLRITAAAADDVAVRNCELWLNGVRQSTDGSFPYEFFTVTPKREVRPTLSVRVRASDLAGNFTWTDELVIELTPDMRPPMITRLVPGVGAVLGRAGGVAAFTNEPVDPSTVTAASFRLSEAGPDNVHGTPDDVAISGAVEVREEVLGMFLNVPGGLAPGRYRATLAGTITDRAGNALPPTTWTFVAYGTGGQADQDGDGVPDELELLLGLNPANPDSNGNGVPDGQEDFDADGVKNAVEVVLGFDLTSGDSDGDGIADKDEDQDLDLVPDAREIELGTSIFAVDTDSDGFADSDELAGSSDPLDPQSVPLRQAGAQALSQNRADPAHRLGRASVVVGAENAVDPAHKAGVARVLVSISNPVDPATALGRAAAAVSARNDAAPDAVSGSTQSKPTTVRNQ